MRNRMPSIESELQRIDQGLSRLLSFGCALVGSLRRYDEATSVPMLADTLISIENVQPQSHSSGTSNANQFISIYSPPFYLTTPAPNPTPRKIITMLID